MKRTLIIYINILIIGLILFFILKYADDRASLSQEYVRNEIEKGKGKQFDPKFADIMLSMIDEDKEYKMHDRFD